MSVFQVSAPGFPYPPSPEILQWLSAGQLASRFGRSLRLWVLLTKLYSFESDWGNILPKKFTYIDIRDRLFADSHSKSDLLTIDKVRCLDQTCICHKRFQDWVFTSNAEQTSALWQQQIIHLTGLSISELEQQLQQCPFATVHRSLRDDLKLLSQMGWLNVVSRGYYQRLDINELPVPPVKSSELSFGQLSGSQTWELLRVLESVAFVQPNLEIVLSSLWEQVADTVSTKGHQVAEPEQRIFLHFDYILSDQMQDRVDSYQEQIEQLWRQPVGGVVQFETWVAEGNRVKVIVYPVCLHYSRRAKYLSAYGRDPYGKIAWHNYRLDRIASENLTVLAWGDPDIPKKLKTMWHTGQLPQPAEIQAKLNEAWGFNFYLPRDLLIIRFPSAFARWYVDNTERHPTFKPVAYAKLPALINREIKDAVQRQQLLEIVKERSSSDIYYCAFIRTGDINVLMRLRDWRPNGEVIAPLSIRQRLATEAAQELSYYQTPQ